MSTLFLRLTIGLYSIGLLHSFLTIITRKKTLFRVAMAGIGLGFISHGLSILFAWVELDHPPITDNHGALSFFAFGIVLAFLISYARYRLESLSVFVFPLVFILTLAANLISSSQTPLQERLRSLWFYIHIPTLFLGYAAFFVAFSAGIMIVFTSSSTVTNLVEMAKPGALRDTLKQTVIAAIGPVTKQTAEGCGLEVQVQPSQYTIPALVDAIVEFYKNAREGTLS